MGVAAYKGRWTNTKIILDFVQKINNDEGWKPYKYSKVRRWMINYMNYSWRKANVRPPRSLRAGFEEDRIPFIQFINNLKLQSLLLFILMNDRLIQRHYHYTLDEKRRRCEFVIRDSNKRFNSIVAQWEIYLYFTIKDETSKKMTFVNS